MYDFYATHMVRKFNYSSDLQLLRIFSIWEALRFMMFSSDTDMIYKNSALQDIFVKLLFIEYRLSKKIPLMWESNEWVHFNK